MSSKLNTEILEAISPVLKPYLDQFYELDRIIPREDEMLIKGTVEKDAPAKTMIIKINVSHEHQQVYIPNIFMPPFMQHKRIGKTLIDLIYKVSKANGYHLFVVDLVPSFYNRLVKRGAAIIEEYEAVQITDETDLIGSGFA